MHRPTRQEKKGGKERFPSYIIAASFMILLSVFCVNPLRAAVKGAFLYDLSNFTGPIPYSAPRVSVDRENNEVSVLFQNVVRVFNSSGMEVFRFGEDLDLGALIDVTHDSDGSILLLSYRTQGDYEITRCNYRGEPIGKVVLKNLPARFSAFVPNRMVCRDGRLHLTNQIELTIVLTDRDGNFKEGYDLFPLIGLPEKERGNIEMWGFDVDGDGSTLFTIPVLFSAYRLSLDGKIVYFGKPGGAPGRFNIVSGIVRDSRGNYLVVDKLKCTVMVFDKNYSYLTQFGFRGFKPGNLIAPDQIAIDRNDRVYVTQNGRRGVSVYQVTHE